MISANCYELRKFLCHIFDFFILWECKTKQFFFPERQKIRMFIIKQCMTKYLLTILTAVIDNVAFLFLFIIIFYQIFGIFFFHVHDTRIFVVNNVKILLRSVIYLMGIKKWNSKFSSMMSVDDCVSYCISTFRSRRFNTILLIILYTGCLSNKALRKVPIIKPSEKRHAYHF